MERRAPIDNQAFLQHVGAGVKEKHRGWKLPTPEGYRSKEGFFKDQCLLVSLVLARLWERVLKNQERGDDHKWLKFYFRLPGRGLGKKGGEKVAEEIELLKQTLHLSDAGPYPLSICEHVAALWQCQIVIYDMVSPPTINSIYPRPFSNSKPTIYLLLSDTLPGISHVEVIKNLPIFFNVLGFVCLSEGCNVKTKDYYNFRHQCRVKNFESCFVCHRTLRNADTYTNVHTEQLFCDSKTSKGDFTEHCPNCNLVIGSLSCKQAHLKRGFCSRKGWQCPICKKIMTGLQKRVRSDHVCHAKPKCKVCFEEKEDENHLCNLNWPRLIKRFDNLGFVHFLASSSAATCVNCFKSESDGEKPCSVHSLGPEKEQVPIVCTFSFEQGKRGHFSSSTFFDPLMNIADCHRPDYLAFNYIPFHASFASESSHLSKEKKTYNFNKPRRKDLFFEAQMLKLKEKKETKTVAEIFITKVLCEEFRNFCFLCASFETMTYVLRALLQHCVPVGSVLRRGTMLIKFVVIPLDITFLCSKQFLKANISEMINLFDIKLSQIFSPSSFSLLDVPISNVLPSVNDFFSLFDKNVEVKKKIEFYDQVKSLPFSLKDSLRQCCQSELDITTLGLLKFLKMAFELQVKCLDNFGPPAFSKAGFLSVLHPFSFCSLSGYTYEVFRLFALEPNKLKIVANEFGTKSRASFQEMLACEFLRWKEPGQWQTEHSSNLGQKKILCKSTGKVVAIADAYNAVTKSCYFFMGCFFHSCTKCGLTKKLKEGSAMQKHLDKRSEVFKSQLEKIRSGLCTPEIIDVKLEWECEFESRKKSDPELAAFLKSPLLRPDSRLVPRDCFRGPLTECYGLQYVKCEAKDAKECVIVDCSSLFSHVGMTFDMPVGGYQIYLGEDIDQTLIGSRDGKLTYKGVPYVGQAQVLVTPPRYLKYPFLQTKIKGTLIATLCRTCSELASQKEVCEMACNHTDKERSFIDSYSTTELIYALDHLGYRLHFFELLLYKNFEKILRPFITILAFEKIRHSAYPNETWSLSEKKDYCKDLNQKMNFSSVVGRELTPDDVAPNKAMRELMKASLNSFIGFFSVNSQKQTHVQFVRTREELMKLWKQGRVVNFDFSTASVLEVALSNENEKPNRKTCISIGSEITACSRLLIHSRIMQLAAKNCVLLKVSCDSLFFLIRRGQEIPLPMSEAFGCFRHVYKGPILAFLQLGIKNYCVLFGDDGRVETDVKISGLQLSHFLTETTLNFQFYRDTFHKLISKHLVRFDPPKLYNIRNVTKKLKVQRVRRLQTIASRSLFLRRQISEHWGNYLTLPYGYRDYIPARLAISLGQPAEAPGPAISLRTQSYQT
jgi:hypothetical protein